MYTNDNYIYTNGNYIYTNDNYIYTKDNYIYTNDNYIYTNDNYFYTNDNYIYTNDNYIYTNDNYIYTNDNYIYTTSIHIGLFCASNVIVKFHFEQDIYNECNLCDFNHSCCKSYRSMYGALFDFQDYKNRDRCDLLANLELNNCSQTSIVNPDSIINYTKVIILFEVYVCINTQIQPLELFIAA